MAKHELLVHSKTRTFACDFQCIRADASLTPKCGKLFSRKWDKKKHLQIVHFRQKEWACGACGKLFGRKKDMQVQQSNLHEGWMRWTCEVLGYGKVLMERGETARHLEAYEGIGQQVMQS